jgi:hypothetical protein
MPLGAFQPTLNLPFFAMMRVSAFMLALVCAASGVAPLSGCRKATPQANSVANGTPATHEQAAENNLPAVDSGTATAGSAPTPAAPPPSAASVIPITPSDPGNIDKTLADLTQALRKYSFEKKRMPQSFSEVIAAGYVQPMPQAPPGKKFEIDPRTRHVALMNQ